MRMVMVIHSLPLATRPRPTLSSSAAIRAAPKMIRQLFRRRPATIEVIHHLPLTLQRTVAIFVTQTALLQHRSRFVVLSAG